MKDTRKTMQVMQAMRILALITDGYGASGGIARYNRDLLSSVAESDSVDRIILLPVHRPSQKTQEPRSPKIRQLAASRWKWIYTFKSLFVAVQHKPDCLFCGHLNLLPLAGVIARMLKIPLWLQIHGIDAWEQPGPCIQRSMRDISLVTGVSRYTRQRFLQWAAIDPGRVKILPNTVAERFQPVHAGQARREFPDIFVTGREKMLLTVGRLAAAEQYKGHDRVLACLPKLLEHYPELLYLIGGTGDDMQRLVGLAEQLGVTEQVRFLGEMQGNRLSSLYAAADLFVMPSTGEGFGIVFLEAMAAGTPAVGLNRAGSTDALQDGKLGTLAEEKQLCSVLLQALAAQKQKWQQDDLSERVRAVFGRSQFQCHVHALIERHLFPGNLS